MLILKDYNPKEHYKILQLWWDQYNWPHLPERALPTGFIAYNNNVPIAASFVYLDINSSFAFIGWPLADKNSESKIRKEAMNGLTQRLIEFCKQNNKDLIYCFSKSEFLVKHYENNGFTKAETNVTTMVRSLDNQDIGFTLE